MAPRRADLLEYEGCNFLRQRLLLSTLSGKPVRVKGIRSDDNEPGLRGKPEHCPNPGAS